MRSLRIEGDPLPDAVEVVKWLVASQAQDFAGAKWALGLRTSGADDTTVERAFNEGKILRTHLLRPTWHFVAPEDIRWLLALTAPRVHAVSAHRYRALGLDAATMGKAKSALERALEGGRQLTRDELRTALERKRIGTEGQRMAYMLMCAELDGVICSGPRRGKQFTYALLEEVVPPVRALSREEALAELVKRYFVSRGPATVRDFSKWSGLSAAEARTGVESVAATLRREVIEGVSCWSGLAATRRRSGGLRAHLLSIYDEYISSYRDRSAICAPVYGKRLVGMGSALAYVLAVDGQIVGTWRRTFAKRVVRMEVTPFRKLTVPEKEADREATGRFLRFLGKDWVLESRSAQTLVS
jgi:hypothetical protein